MTSRVACGPENGALTSSAIIESVRRLCPHPPTPFLFFDEAKLVANYTRSRLAIEHPRTRVFYSVKANSDKEVLASLARLGSGFDIASLGELLLVKDLGVSSDRITFSAPVKIPDHIEQAFKLGVRLFAADSICELDKLAALAPGSHVLVRLAVSNEGSLWPLVLKFGCGSDEALSLLQEARRLGLSPCGLTFHVGSQCLRPNTWIEALTQAKRVWDAAAAESIHLRLLDIGGGFPAPYTGAVPAVTEIGEQISRFIECNFPPTTEIVLEPGRNLVADAAVLVTSVIGRAMRDGARWVYADLSIYSGLLEAAEHWQYTILADTDSAERSDCILAGPTCDSTDVISHHAVLPDLRVGDRLYILSAGAYTVSYAAYNGYAYPHVCFLPSQPLRTVLLDGS